MTTTMNTGAASLLPCPFCGGAARLQPAFGNDLWWVACATCDFETNPRKTREATVAAWNRRATPQADAAIAAGGAQEAIYQVMVGEKWVDSTAAEYAAVSNEKRIVYAAPLHRVAATVPFQQRVQPWMMECFGPVIADDRMERNHRFFEEATELVQACGMTASEAHQLVDYTFSRPVGEPSQEVGGVMVTLAALCLANRLDMHDSGETELARINVPETVAKIRAKQAAKPKHSPLPAAPAASNGEQA